MTYEDQRIALAKWMGFELSKEGVPYLLAGELATVHPVIKVPGSDIPLIVPLPDFTGLDAIAKAEGKLEFEEFIDYLKILLTITDEDPSAVWSEMDWESRMAIVCAKPAQRLEAILRALSLWTESP